MKKVSSGKGFVKELLYHIQIFILFLWGDQAADGLRPMIVLDFIDLGGQPIQRLFPGGINQLPVFSDPGFGQPVF